MDIQNILTLTIEVIFWGMIFIMTIDFVNGIYTVISAQTASPGAETKDIPNPVFVESEAETKDIEKFEEIPDPWDLEVEFHTTAETRPVVTPFPALRLLPPAQEPGTALAETPW